MALEDLQKVPAGSDRQTASLYLVPLDSATGERMDDFSPIRLQWWPDSMEYERGDIGWQSQKVPGLSHEIHQWTANGSPTLSFEIVWTAERDPAYKKDGGKTDQGFLKSGGGESRKEPYSVDINKGMAWLTAMSNPSYSDRDAEKPVNPPPIIQIIPEYLPPGGQSDDFGSAFGLDTSDFSDPYDDKGASRQRGLNLSQQVDRDFYGHLTNLSGTYEKSFPSGAPRYVTSSVSFIETIQFGDTIIPHDRGGNLEVAREFELAEDPSGR